MKKILLLLFLALCINKSYAQNRLKDSLKLLLQKEKQDTSRVMLLNELNFYYGGNKPDTTMLLALEALSLSQRIGFVKGETASLNRIGLTYWTVGNNPKAMEAFLKALKLDEKINNLVGIARDLNGIGHIYRDQGQYYQAIDYYLKSRKLTEQLNNRLVIAGLVGLSRSYFGLKLYDSARVYAQQGYEISSKNNNPFGTGTFLSLMGDIYSETGQKKLALEYYRLSIPFSKLMENDRILSTSFLGMAKSFENEGQIDSTLFYANQAFEISRGAGFSKGALDASSFLYSFYNKRGNLDRALFYLQLATVAKDSLFSQQKTIQLQSLDFDEKLRQMEITTAEFKVKEDRKHNLQYAAIAVGLITFVILFVFLSHSIVVKTKFIEFFGVLGLLSVFEFINLFIHPYLSHATNDSPVLMLLILIAIGALLVPLHHKLEKWMTEVMVEKNKKIRLEAAKKTIQNLEG
jgi:tetratricopeptide (TPR) repeat protein